jgi:hypothetical protein
MVCAPSIAAAAAFLAIIFLDLYNRDYGRIPGHALMGVFAALLLSFICERTSSFVGWILLGAPFVVVGIGYSLYKLMDSKPTPTTPPKAYPCQCCNIRPCQCFRPCVPPTPPKPAPPTPPKPEPKPKPDDCIDSSLKD